VADGVVPSVVIYIGFEELVFWIARYFLDPAARITTDPVTVPEIKVPAEEVGTTVPEIGMAFPTSLVISTVPFTGRGLPTSLVTSTFPATLTDPFTVCVAGKFVTATLLATPPP
jgi:hypothetical protein